MRHRRQINHHITDAVWKGFGIWLLIAAVCLAFVILTGCRIHREAKTETKFTIEKNK